MSGYKYLKSTRDSREAVALDILRRGQYVTTCMVDVDLLLCGIRSFPCGSGDDMTLTAQQRLDVLELVQAERKKLTTMEVKTLDGWHNCGLSFDEFCFPGDTVSEDVVDYFVNVVPPVTLSATCVQAGEPYSSEADENGRFRPTYTTFHRLDKDRWQYDGCCFMGDCRNRVAFTFRQRQLHDLMEQARKEVIA